MKKFYFLFLFALIASVSNLWAAEVVLWEEDFSSNSLSGYTTTNSNTKLYKEFLAGGTSPELLIAKNSGSFEVKVSDLQGCSGTLTLTFKCNKTASTFANVTTSTTGVSVSTPKNANGVWTTEFNVPANTQSLTFKVANTNSGNGRYDDFKLVGNKELPKCAAPTFSLENGGYYRGEQTLKIESATAGSLIHYEIKRNGAQWGELSWYKGETPQTVTLSDQGVYTVTAHAYVSNESMEDSASETITFTISDKCATPTFNLENNKTYTDEQTLIIYSATPNTVVNYNVKRNGESYAYASDVDAHDPIKIEIGLTGNYTVTASAYINDLAPAFEDSEEATLAFTIEKNCATPTFSLDNDGIYTDFQTLKISSATEGAIIYYTVEGYKTDKIDSFGNSPVSIPLNANDTYIVTAKATKANYNDSAEESIMFTINKTCDAPTFDLTAGTYTTAQTVTITGPEGSTITYTLNDDIQEAASPAVVELPLVEGEVTTYNLSALASLTGANDSQEVTAVYVINPNHEDKTATFVVADYAAENGWVNKSQEYEAIVDGIVFTASAGSYNGRYWNNKEWRFYGTDKGTLTITAPAKHILTSVKFTNVGDAFATVQALNNKDEGDIVTFNDSEWENTGDPVNKVIFAIETSGQTAEITKIEIGYAYDPTSSVSKVSTEDGVKVVAAEGGVEVVAAEAADVAVYTVAGQLVRAQRVAEGSTLVNVPAGFYVVRAAGTVAKVVVK